MLKRLRHSFQTRAMNCMDMIQWIRKTHTKKNYFWNIIWARKSWGQNVRSAKFEAFESFTLVQFATALIIKLQWHDYSFHTLCLTPIPANDNTLKGKNQDILKSAIPNISVWLCNLTKSWKNEVLMTSMLQSFQLYFKSCYGDLQKWPSYLMLHILSRFFPQHW